MKVIQEDLKGTELFSAREETYSSNARLKTMRNSSEEF